MRGVEPPAVRANLGLGLAADGGAVDVAHGSYRGVGQGDVEIVELGDERVARGAAGSAAVSAVGRRAPRPSRPAPARARPAPGRRRGGSRAGRARSRCAGSSSAGGPTRRRRRPRAMTGPTARAHSSWAALTSASQNSTRIGRCRPGLRSARSTVRSMPAQATASGMPASAQPLTRSKAGPTMRIRWPPLRRQRCASTARQ